MVVLTTLLECGKSFLRCCKVQTNFCIHGSGFLSMAPGFGADVLHSCNDGIPELLDLLLESIGKKQTREHFLSCCAIFFSLDIAASAGIQHMQLTKSTPCFGRSAGKSSYPFTTVCFFSSTHPRGDATPPLQHLLSKKSLSNSKLNEQNSP